jgi:hypothetical protein
MQVVDYTTYAEIRAVLGASSTELPDTVLSQAQWGTQLLLSFEDISETLLPTYTAISALSEGSRSAKEQRLYLLLRLYASYSTAKCLLTSLPMFSVLSLTDGRADFQRQTDILQDMRDGVDSDYLTIRERLVNAFAALGYGSIYVSTPQIYTVSTGLSVNPVTNT